MSSHYISIYLLVHLSVTIIYSYRDLGFIELVGVVYKRWKKFIRMESVPEFTTPSKAKTKEYHKAYKQVKALLELVTMN